MSAPSFLEDHISQIPALQLLINIGYEYVTPAQAMEWRNDKKSVVLFEDILKNQLKKINTFIRKGEEYKFSDTNISSAILAIKDLLDNPVQETINS